MGIGRTSWTACQLADWLGTATNHTTDVLSRFCSIAEGTLLSPHARRRLAASSRPDRVAQAALAFLDVGGRLARSDPGGLRKLLTEIAQGAECRKR